MARAYKNEELREAKDIMEEFGASRPEIAKEIKKMRRYNPDEGKKETRGMNPEHLSGIKAQREESLKERHSFR